MDTLRAVRVSALAKELARVAAGGDFEAMPRAGWGGAEGCVPAPTMCLLAAAMSARETPSPQAVDMLRAAQVSALARSWQR